jgi:hypothetical protein
METVCVVRDDAGGLVARYVQPSCIEFRFRFPNPFADTGSEAVVYRDLALVVTNTHESETLRLPFNCCTTVEVSGMGCLLTAMVDQETQHQLVGGVLGPGASITVDLDARALCEGVNGVYVTKETTPVHLDFVFVGYSQEDLHINLLARSIEVVSWLPRKASLGIASRRKASYCCNEGGGQVVHKL